MKAMRVGDGHSYQSHRNPMNMKRCDNISWLQWKQFRQQNEIKKGKNFPTTNTGNQIRASAIIFYFYRVIGNRKTILAHRIDSNRLPEHHTMAWISHPYTGESGRALYRRMETDQLHAPWKLYPLSDVVIIVERDIGATRRANWMLNGKYRFGIWDIWMCTMQFSTPAFHIIHNKSDCDTFRDTSAAPFRRSAI